MTSKVSYFKLLKQDLKRSGGIIAVITLALFLGFTVLGIMELDSMLSVMRQGDGTLADVTRKFSVYVSFNQAIMVITILSAVLCGVSRFAYLHSPVKLDLYHSIPVKRERLFGIQYLSGVLQYAVPMLVNMVVLLVIGAVRGVTTGGVVGQAAVGILVSLLFYLLVYTVVILAMLLTGKIVVGILGILVFVLYLPGTFLLFSLLFELFFETFYTMGDTWAELVTKLSPVLLYNDALNLASQGQIFFREMLFALVGLLAVLALCIYLNHIRPSEAAGKAMAFPKSEAVIKFLLVVPISVGFGYVARVMALEGKDVWLALGMAFGLVVGSGIIEMIYHMDFSKVLNRKKLLLASALVAFGVMGIFRFDLFGYDKYIPDRESVESAAVYLDGMATDSYEVWNSDNNYVESMDSREYVFENMCLTDLDGVYKIVEAAMSTDKSKSTSNVIVKYRFKNGKEKNRSYRVEYDLLLEEVKKLYEDREFKEGIYPILNLTGDEISKISLLDSNGQVQLNINRKQVTSLVDTFREDLASATFDEYTESSMAGIRFEGMNAKIPSGTYILYPGFTRTLSLLKELGYETYARLEPDKVISATVTRYEDTGSREETFETKKDILEIMENAVPSFGNEFFLQRDINGEYDVMITYASQIGDTVTAYMQFSGKDLPKCVEKRFGGQELSGSE